jgi:hypothetical protein
MSTPTRRARLRSADHSLGAEQGQLWRGHCRGDLVGQHLIKAPRACNTHCLALYGVPPAASA